MAENGYAVGAFRVLLWKYTSTGVAIGQSSALSAGAGSGAYVLSDVKSADAQFAEVTDLNIQGGDKIVATVSWGNPKLAPFDITASNRDTTLNDFVTGATSITSNAYQVLTSYNPNRGFPANIGVAITQRYVIKTTGVSKWVTRIIPKATVTLRPGGATFRGESDTVLRVAPINSTSTYTGQSYGSGGLGFTWEEDMGDYYELITDYPIHLYTFRQDASATTYTLPYRPIDTTITLGATPNVQVVNGAAAALSSINTSTGVATMAAAGTSGNFAVLTYTTNFIPV